MAERTPSRQCGLAERSLPAARRDPLAILKEVEEEMERQVAAARVRNGVELDGASGVHRSRGGNEEEEAEEERLGIEDGSSLITVGVAPRDADVNDSGLPNRVLELRASRIQTSR